MSKILNGLNQDQIKAVKHNEGPCIIIAGAGTGKTKVLTTRIAYLIQNNFARPDEILALTFTDKATAEMQERIDLMMPLSYQEIWINTFHSFCDKILRQRGIEIGIDPGYKIITVPDLLMLIKKNLFKFSLDYYRPLGNPSKFLLEFISYFSKLKDENISPKKYLEWIDTNPDRFISIDDPKIRELETKKHKELSRFYSDFQQLLIGNNFLDYGDLIFYTLKLFNKRPNVLNYYQNNFKYILVDEYQDTNFSQNELVDALSGTHKNIMVVGDDDQAIYKFRGASVSNILGFQKKYPKANLIVLKTNYRSKQSILDLAYNSIQNNNPDRLENLYKIEKRLVANQDIDTSKIFEIHTSSIEKEIEKVVETINSLGYEFKDIAILGRARNHIKPFYEALIKNGYPAKMLNEENYKNKPIIKDLINILRVACYPNNDTNWFRVLTMRNWGLSMDYILSIISRAGYNGLWEYIKKTEELSEIKEFFIDLIESSRDLNVTEILFNKILNKLNYFNDLQKEDSKDSYLSIQYIAALLNESKQFVENNKNCDIKSYIDYLDLTEESGSNKMVTDGDDDNSITLSTVHGVKGLEYKVVFIVNLVNGRFPSKNKKDLIEIPQELRNDRSETEHINEERRLFYVAITRAKELLYLSYSDYKSIDSKRKQKKSVFLSEIEEKKLTINKNMCTNNTRPNKPVESPSNKPISISYSHLNCYQVCPKKYLYQYIYKIPTPPSAALSFGTTLHNTLSEFYKAISNKQASMFDDKENEVSLERLLDIYKKSWVPYGYKSKAHMLARKNRGKEILTEYYKKFEDYFGNPLYLEKSFTLKLDNIIIRGRFDRVDSLTENNIEIFDYKTGRTKTQKDVDNDLQLSIYAMAAQTCFHKHVSRLSLYFLDENIKIETTRDDQALEKATNKIKDIVNNIQNKNYTPKPSNIMCKLCDYKHICDDAML